MSDKPILDPCCGSRMFWFDKKNPQVVFGDLREETITVIDRSHYEDGTRTLTVAPDRLMDFRALPFHDCAFRLVVFDPPHLVRAGADSWMKAKYGKLDVATWRDDLRAGFSECFRVLQPDGILIFKWNEIQIKTREVLALTPYKPLFGHPSGKRSGTHWICFMKDPHPVRLHGGCVNYGPSSPCNRTPALMGETTQKENYDERLNHIEKSR